MPNIRVVTVCSKGSITFWLSSFQSQDKRKDNDYLNISLACPKLRRRAALMVLEKTAEGRLVGKTETVGNLLYAHFGAFQILPREYHGDVTNPLQGTFPAPFTDNGREVIRREILLTGIILHGSVSVAVLIHRDKKAVEHRIITVLGHSLDRSVAEIGFEHFQAKGIAQMAQTAGIEPADDLASLVGGVAAGSGSLPAIIYHAVYPNDVSSLRFGYLHTWRMPYLHPAAYVDGAYHGIVNVNIVLFEYAFQVSTFLKNLDKGVGRVYTQVVAGYYVRL